MAVRAVRRARGRDRGDSEVETTPESTSFVTALIVHSLGFPTRRSPTRYRAEPSSSLRPQMERGGVWCDWTAEDEHHRTIPPDLDDTACRHLIKDRMDITGARWGLQTAEAVLEL